VSLGALVLVAGRRSREPEFIEAPLPPLPPPPPSSFGRLLHQTEDRLCLQRSAKKNKKNKKSKKNKKKRKKRKFLRVSLDRFQCKCQEEKNTKNVL